MAEEVMEYLLSKNPGNYLDCTMGGGGHSRIIAERLQNNSQLTCLDRDADAIAHAGQDLEQLGARVIHTPFSKLSLCAEPGSLDGILFDFGVSSHQLDDGSRGFSMDGEEILDMRMDDREELDAGGWVAQSSEEEIQQALSRNSDLPKARRMARGLKELVADGRLPLSGVRELVLSLFPEARRTPHKWMARVLQAIRMEVNSELDEISQAIPQAVEALATGGRLVMLTYHSVEDRQVKQALMPMLRDCICPENLPVCQCGGNHRKLKKVIRKPMLPGKEEISRNPRARSAKMRVLERL